MSRSLWEQKWQLIRWFSPWVQSHLQLGWKASLAKTTTNLNKKKQCKDEMSRSLWEQKWQLIRWFSPWVQPHLHLGWKASLAKTTTNLKVPITYFLLFSHLNLNIRHNELLRKKNSICIKREFLMPFLNLFKLGWKVNPAKTMTNLNKKN